jgi:serine phosphatase RsbU (regulator of sigma subunit)
MMRELEKRLDYSAILRICLSFLGKLLCIFIIFLNFQYNNLFGQDNSIHRRMLLFNKIGQKELVKVGENVSVVLGPSIKPEYSYLSYSTGNKTGEYFIELKSNEPLLKQINILKSRVDSLKTNAVISDKKKDSSSNNQPQGLAQSKDKKSNRQPDIYASSDKYIPLSTNHYLSYDLGKHIKSIDTIREYIRKNNRSIDNNVDEIERNKKHIDTLKNAIEDITRTGANKERLKDLISEIDSLLSFNNTLQEQNKNLSENKFYLEKELKLREQIYNSLIKIIVFLILIISLIIILTYIIYRNYRQKKKFSLELAVINEKLEKTNSELNKSNAQLLSQNLQIQDQYEQLSHLNNEKDRLLKLIQYELRNAAEYLKSLIPKPFKNKQIETDWFFMPTEDLGGDSFGYNWIDKENFAIYLLDVSGHGIGAALHSVQVLNLLQNKTLPAVDFTKPEEVLSSLNKIFQMKDHNDKYFTIWYGVFNIPTGTLKYSSAGHPPAMLISKDKKIDILGNQTIFIGASLDTIFKFNQVSIDGSASLYLYSDGVYEIEKSNNKMYTIDDFQKELLQKIESKSQKLDSLYELAKSISGKEILDDDYTILKVKFEKSKS